MDACTRNRSDRDPSYSRFALSTPKGALDSQDDLGHEVRGSRNPYNEIPQELEELPTLARRAVKP